MRSLGISVLSLTLTTIVIANAYYQKKQFYPSVVYITKSNPSMAVIYIQAFICVWITGKIMRKIFFGQLRTTEFEHLMERSWYAITETCLAFTVFRDDFNPKFVALFTLLLFLKSFHWLAEDRVDYMERSPVISWLFHIRVLSLLLLLGSLDMYFIQHAYQSTVTKGASVQLVFGFEYAILITVVANIAIKYGLHSVDLNSDTPWDNKAVFLLYTELVMGLIKVILYVAFVAIMVRIYTLPLFAFRPMYYTIRNFKKAFSDVILSRRAIHNMNTLYPDATAEELRAADNVCIICREEMTTASKKLPCNHIFHTSCLRSWFQRQQTCPTCRLNILHTPTNNNDPRQNQRHRNAPPAGPVAAPGVPGGPNQPNPFFNPFLAGANPFQMFNPGAPNGGLPPQHPQQQQAAPAQPNNEQAGPAPPGASAPGSSNMRPPTNPVYPAFAFPPFPFLPFMAPPPVPPANLRTLSPEELRRMEGNEMENVEARIQCLRNIQIMLDAAIVMMQQYTVAASVSSQMPQGTSSSNQQQPPQPANTNDTAPTSSNSCGDGVQTSSSTSTACNGVTSTESAGTNSIPQANGESTSLSNSTMGEQTTSTPEEEVRRRRLQKFLLHEQQEAQPQ
ncbi:E3 ubiquitin-protein ligase synoviolin A [Aethina tumida]|uniref:E3 ubiquitin-protein ligase synoviolin A n=1 Tax=Aethina tumida TaxID=116153 RepID=UPI002148E3CC|nr:E3 ubiquitin-protein ligase synoviolin A [Aethina tumida]